MKKLFVALMLVLFVSSFSFAQINKGWDGTKPEVYKGSKYMTFMYSPFVDQHFAGVNSGSFLNFTLQNPGQPIGVNNLPVVGAETKSNLAGVGIGMFVTSRLSLDFALSFANSAYEFTATHPNTTLTETSKLDQTMFGFGVDANYHLTSLYSVSPYIGVNLNLGMISGTADFTNNHGIQNDPNVLKAEYSSTGIYGGFNLGFDWYFTPGLALGGKYTLGFSSFGEPTYKSTQGNVSFEPKGGKLTEIGTSITSIFLKVHF